MKTIIRKAMLKTMILLLLLCMLPFSQAFAFTQTQELTTVNTQCDILVQLTFDGAAPKSIAFISPSGVRYEESVTPESNMKTAKGDEWIHYKIYSAEVGTWTMEYDSGNSQNLQYSVSQSAQDLIIQNFDIISVNNEYAKVSFHTSYDGSGSYYNYEIYAIVDAEGHRGNKLLKTGSAASDNDFTTDVNLTSLSSYGGYKLRLEVYKDTGFFEVSDNAETEAFSYTNPNASPALSDVDLTVDTTAMMVAVNWRNYTGDDVFISAFADGNTEPFFYQDTAQLDTEELYFDYFESHSDITLYVQTRRNGVLSEPLIKEIPVKDLAVTIDANETTNQNQAKISYDMPEATEATLTLNDESQPIRLDGKNSFTVTLSDDYNTLSVTYKDKGITYIVSKNTFLDRIAPPLTIYEDLDNKTFETNELLLSGETEPSAQISINGESFTVDESGTFLQKVTLTSGKNVLEIVASDSVGNNAIQTITVFCNAEESATIENLPGFLQTYLPLLIALAVSLICILFTLLFLRGRNAPLKFYDKTLPFKINMLNWAANTCFILAVIGGMYALLNFIEFIRIYQIVNADSYLSLAEKSVSTAYSYLERKDFCFISLIVGGIVMVLSIIGGIILKSTFNKKKRTY